jgi:hypothetical protein
MAQHANPVEMLRNSKIGMYVYPVVTQSSATGAMNKARGVTLLFYLISPIIWTN